MDFAAELAKLLAAAEAALTAEEYQALFETPPEREMGDYALPCFKLARTMRKARTTESRGRSKRENTIWSFP